MGSELTAALKETGVSNLEEDKRHRQEINEVYSHDSADAGRLMAKRGHDDDMRAVQPFGFNHECTNFLSEGVDLRSIYGDE